jgi:type IV secretion system protein VirB10
VSAAAEEKRLARALRLRGPAPAVTRLSRRAAVVAAGLAAIVVATVCGWALTVRPPVPRTDPAESSAEPAPPAPPERLSALPRDYVRPPPADVPRLEPPMAPSAGLAPAGPPGAMSPPPGRPVASGAIRPADDADPSAAHEARASRLFGPASAPPRLAEAAPVAAQPAATLAVAPARAVRAGTVLKAALLHALRSDVPGPAVAQVTEPIVDPEDDAVLLIPVGARLLGGYARPGALGQDRIAVSFTALELPDGRRLELAGEPALDEAGRAGLPGRVDARWGDPLRGAALALGLSVAGELAAPDQGALGAALGRGVQDTAVMAGAQLMGRGLQAPPAIEVAAGAAVRVMLSRDLDLSAMTSRSAVMDDGPDASAVGRELFGAAPRGDHPFLPQDVDLAAAAEAPEEGPSCRAPGLNHVGASLADPASGSGNGEVVYSELGERPQEGRAPSALPEIGGLGEGVLQGVGIELAQDLDQGARLGEVLGPLQACGGVATLGEDQLVDGEARGLGDIHQHAGPRERQGAHGAVDQPREMLQGRGPGGELRESNGVFVVPGPGRGDQVHQIALRIAEPGRRRLGPELANGFERRVGAPEDRLEGFRGIGGDGEARGGEVEVAGHQGRGGKAGADDGRAHQIRRRPDKHAPGLEQAGVGQRVQDCAHGAVGDRHALAPQRRHEPPALRRKPGALLEGGGLLLDGGIAGFADELVDTRAPHGNLGVDIFDAANGAAIDRASPGSCGHLLLQVADQRPQGRREAFRVHTDSISQSVCKRQCYRQDRDFCL